MWRQNSYACRSAAGELDDLRVPCTRWHYGWHCLVHLFSGLESSERFFGEINAWKGRLWGIFIMREKPNRTTIKFPWKSPAFAGFLSQCECFFISIAVQVQLRPKRAFTHFVVSTKAPTLSGSSRKKLVCLTRQLWRAYLGSLFCAELLSFSLITCFVKQTDAINAIATRFNAIDDLIISFSV